MDYQNVTSMEEAYNLAKEGGFTGTQKEFEEACAKVSEAMSTNQQLNVEDMDKIAGGGSVSDVIDWIKENPAATVGIGLAVTATVATAVGIGVCLYKTTQITDNMKITDL